MTLVTLFLVMTTVKELSLGEVRISSRPDELSTEKGTRTSDSVKGFYI